VWVELKTVEALVSVGARYVGRAPTLEVGPPWWSEVADIIEQVQQYDETLAPAVLGRSAEHRWLLLAHAPGVDCWEPDRATIDGDFHPGNWRSDGTTRAIVDWADTFVGHPATDIQRLIGWLPSAQRDHALEVWTSEWKAYRPAADPLRAVAPMAVLARLIYAIMYQRILDNIEPAERNYHEDDPAAELRAAAQALRGGKR
jgi:Ser/Thr protein kinase RdoA (MazF antagonist)